MFSYVRQLAKAVRDAGADEIPGSNQSGRWAVHVRLFGSDEVSVPFDATAQSGLSYEAAGISSPQPGGKGQPHLATLVGFCHVFTLGLSTDNTVTTGLFLRSPTPSLRGGGQRDLGR